MVLGIIGAVIIALLLIIIWKLASPTIWNQSNSTTATPTLGSDKPAEMIMAYYQAIGSRKADWIKTAWADPNSRQARYAVQAIRDFPNALCRPLDIVNASPEGAVDAVVQVTLECRNTTTVENYPVIFQLGQQSGNWRIIKLQTSGISKDR